MTYMKEQGSTMMSIRKIKRLSLIILSSVIALVVLHYTNRVLISDTFVVFLGQTPLNEYTFKGNWYFLGGDNVLDSRDSRYFGLVPEEYIVGIVII